MKCFEQFIFLREDLRQWTKNISSKKDYFYLIFEFGVWAVVLYRISRFLFLIDIPVLKIVFRLLAFFIYKFNELFGCAIKPGCNIGAGLYIGHIGVIRLHPDVKAGRNLSIGQLVTIGTRGLGSKGVPEIGDNVYIGVGAKVLGNIKIGNNVKIGANAVVINDVPDNATAVGIPARVVKINNKRIT